MSTTYDYDVLYLGAGHGAFDGAPMLTAQGKKVAMVERDTFGGTCPNWGCNAKIALENAASLRRELKASEGIVEGSGAINWQKNVAHKNDIVKVFPNALQGLMEGANVDVFFGDGRFIDAHTVQAGDKQLTAENIVIATGMHSHRLNIEGAEYLHDSKDFLSNEEAPEKMVVIGAGYIGLESAAMMQAAGTDVTVIMRGDRALAGFPADYVDKLLAALEAQGLTFVKNANTTAVEKTANGYTVKTSAGDFEAGYVLDATGRIPNTEGMGLEEVGIDFDKGGIITNDHLQTSLPNVYATGDVLHKDVPKLTPTATFESQYVADQINGDDKEAIDYPAIGTNVFTTPRLAQAGVSLAEAKANPDKYDVVESDVMADWFRLVDYEKSGQISTIFNKQGQLVGVVELSEHAEDIVNALLPAIEFGYTKKELRRLVTIFPTIGYSALGDLG